MSNSETIKIQLRRLAGQKGSKSPNWDIGIKERNATSLLTLVVCLALISILYWTSTVELDEVVRGNGQVIPNASTRVIQSLEAGLIKEIMVSEGADVTTGEILLVLHDDQISSIYEQDIVIRDELLARTARLLAEAKDSSAPIFDNTLLKKKKTLTDSEKQLFDLRRKDQQTLKNSISNRLALAEEKLSLIEPAVKRGSVSRMEALKIEEQIQELESNLETLQSKFQRDAMERYDEESSRLLVLEQSIRGHRDRLDRTIIRSPVNGVVNAIFIETSERVVNSGEAIMEIVPGDEDLVVEAKLSPKDIAFVKIGQNASVRFTAFDPSIYGGLEGRVTTIGVDTIANQDGELYYPIKVHTNSESLGNDPSTGKSLNLVPGMIAEVDIITGRKSLFSYLTKPIQKARYRALREK